MRKYSNLYLKKLNFLQKYINVYQSMPNYAKVHKSKQKCATKSMLKYTKVWKSTKENAKVGKKNPYKSRQKYYKVL